jgi:hypothetical protein
VTLPFKSVNSFPYEQVAQVWGSGRLSAYDYARAVKFYADEYVKLLARGTQPVETALQGVALDDLAVVAIPGELFVELGGRSSAGPHSPRRSS